MGKRKECMGLYIRKRNEGALRTGEGAGGRWMEKAAEEGTGAGPD